MIVIFPMEHTYVQRLFNSTPLYEICISLNSSHLRIIFFGTPAFAAYSLEQISNGGYNIVAVVTAADKPAGRGMKIKSSEVKIVAEKLGIPVLQPQKLKDPNFLKELESLNADLGIVIAFRMLPQMVWSMPKLGTFNLHASLLPQYRGAAPINHAIINGEVETGVTTFFLKHEIDTGDIIEQQTVNITSDDNAGTLHDKLMHKGADLVLSSLELITKGNWPEKPQSEILDLTLAPKLNRDFCELDYNQTAVSVHNKIRGLSPYPGAWIKSQYGVIKVYRSEISSNVQVQSGLYIENYKLLLGCNDGVLELLEIQSEGKPRMKATDFINGLVNR